MASLRSMILDGRSVHYNEKVFTREDSERRCDLDRADLQSRETIFVNAQKVYESMRDAKNSKIDMRLIPCPMPPYRKMWLEAIFDDNRRLGAMVRRCNADEFQTHFPQEAGGLVRLIQEQCPTTFVHAHIWAENRQGRPALFASTLYWLDAKGTLQTFFPGFDLSGEILSAARWPQDWILHAFARLNCHNVKLVEMAGGASKPKKNDHKHPPFSLPWNEIAVTGLEQLQREKNETAPDGEKREIRFHKVRGHYADYTKGKGLFGKYKVRLYIEEHTAGEPELGTVVSSYRV